mgnify:CR=1 FL=1
MRFSDHNAENFHDFICFGTGLAMDLLQKCATAGRQGMETSNLMRADLRLERGSLRILDIIICTKGKLFGWRGLEACSITIKYASMLKFCRNLFWNIPDGHINFGGGLTTLSTPPTSANLSIGAQIASKY